MRHEIEQAEAVQIESADDAWAAMYEHGVKKSLGGILEYFMSHRDSDDLVGFCHSLDEHHLRESLDYFFGNFNQDKFVRFFDNLSADQQTTVLSYLLNDVCESKVMAQEKKIIQFRQNLSQLNSWKNQKRLPANVKSAIESAQDNSFDEVIYFLRKNPLEIRKFVSQLSSINKNMILNGLTLELINKLPYTDEIPPEQHEMPFAA